MRILAVDPGPTTGFALFDSDGMQGPNPHCWFEPLDTNDEPHTNLWNIINDFNVDVLVVERFEFRQSDAQTRSKIDYRAGEYVGVCCLWAQQEGIKLVLQQAAQAKAFWMDDKIKQLTLWRPEAFPHGIDALRHLMYYVTFTLNDQRWLLQLRK